MATLSSVAEIIMGQSPPSDTYNDKGDGLPFYQGKADFGFKYPTPRLYCTSPQKTAEAGETLISVRAPVGPTNIASEKSCIGRGLAAIRAKGIDSEFLFFNLRYIEPYIASLGTGSTFTAINKHHLANLEVNPKGYEIPEQRRIARVLATVQTAIEQQARLIALTRELKFALMRKLFTEGLRGEKQKETEIGLVPKSWRVVELGSLAHIGNGSTPKRDNKGYWDGGSIPWLTSGKIHERFIEQADELVTDLAVEECHLPRVRANSLLIAITGQGKTLGNSALVKFATCISQHLAYAQFHTEEVVPEFMLWYLQTRYQHLRSVSQAGGSTKGALTCGYIKTYPVPLPSVGEQNQIAKICAILEKKERNHERRRLTLEELFRTLLHQLMTGQVRVNGPELDFLIEGEIK